MKTTKEHGQKYFLPVEWQARSPDLHMPDFFLCTYIKWMVAT